jgi:hypothetical protein
MSGVGAEGLREALARSEEQCKAYGARAEQACAVLRAFMNLEIVAVVGPDGVTLNPTEQWYDSYVAATQRAAEALNTAPSAGVIGILKGITRAGDKLAKADEKPGHVAYLNKKQMAEEGERIATAAESALRLLGEDA